MSDTENASWHLSPFAFKGGHSKAFRQTQEEARSDGDIFKRQ